MTISRPCLVGLLCCAIQCVGQQLPADTMFLTSAKNNQVRLYTDYIVGQTRLNNGSEHRDYLARNDEHPYFGQDDWQNGSIVYDEESYANVPMFYDLSRDKVITEHSINGSKLELISEKIVQFSLGGHTFHRLKRDQSKIITEGFYDVLYDGKTKVYVRREKALQQKVESNDIIFTFQQKNRIYVFKDGVYHPVKKKGSLLDVFEDRKAEVRAFLNKSGTKYRADRESAIARVAEFYDAQNQ
ncbi:MAG TPA: hypothetical protein VK589_12500 [Chryseolinea sp.]|nr:hypothetical protein [Chryseolinea sp.]